MLPLDIAKRPLFPQDPRPAQTPPPRTRQEPTFEELLFRQLVDDRLIDPCGLRLGLDIDGQLRLIRGDGQQ